MTRPTLMQAARNLAWWTLYLYFLITLSLGMTLQMAILIVWSFHHVGLEFIIAVLVKES